MDTQLQGNFKFLKHSIGVFTTEDNQEISYDSVELSNGLRAFKAKNKTGKKKFDYKEGDQVICTFDIEPNKNGNGLVVLVDIA